MDSYNARNAQLNRMQSGRKVRGFPTNSAPSQQRETVSAPQKYTGAPYNFVPFSNKVMLNEESENVQERGHDCYIEGRHSGEIICTVTAETPIFISNGNKEESGTRDFYKNTSGQYAIPGSSFRGLVRSNMRVLSFGYYGDSVDDRRLMYRAITKNGDNEVSVALNNAYKEIIGIKQNKQGQDIHMLTENVHGGYIKKVGDHYQIFASAPEKTDGRGYYTLRETYIIDRVKEAEANKQSNPFSLLISHTGEMDGCRLQHYDWYDENGFRIEYQRKNGKNMPSDLWDTLIRDTEDASNWTVHRKNGFLEYVRKKRSVMLGSVWNKLIKGSEDEKNWIKHILGKENTQYIPSVVACSYELSSNGKVLFVGYLNDYKYSGTVLTVGKMKEHKQLYVFPKFSEQLICSIPETEAESFQYDWEVRKNTLKAQGADFFALPKAGEAKPVFYIEYGGHVYFGFTPLLRLFYNHTIHDGLPEAHRLRQAKDDEIYSTEDYPVADYVHTIFGYAKKKESYRSRVSFGDLTLDDPLKTSQKAVKVVLGEPKPTSYPDYLKQTGPVIKNGYNSDSFELRGAKQFWLHPVVDGSSDKENVNSTLHPLPVGCTFTGKIRFTNLTDAELGALLWSIALTDSSHQNIGMGKPYGYGRIQVKIRSLKEWNLEKAYNLDTFAADGFDDSTRRISAYRKAFEEKVTQFDGNQKKFAEITRIKTFLSMKETIIADTDLVRYMRIGDKEYQSRAAALPTANDVLKKVQKQPAEPKKEEPASLDDLLNSLVTDKDKKHKKRR